MRILTHNFLQSNVKGTTKGYPLKIEPTKIVVETSPLDVELTTKMLLKVNYEAVLGAIDDIRTSTTTDSSESSESSAITIPDNIPQQLPEINDDNNTFREDIEESTLQSLHFVLFNLHVLEGSLICPDTGRKFPIKDGIPNMILHEDEI